MGRLRGNGVVVIGGVDFIQSEMARQGPLDEKLKEGDDKVTGGMDGETAAEMEVDDDSSASSNAT